MGRRNLVRKKTTTANDMIMTLCQVARVHVHILSLSRHMPSLMFILSMKVITLSEIVCNTQLTGYILS